MHSPQLRRTEATSSPHATTPRKQLIDKLVRHRIGDQFQEIHCSNRRKVLTHDQRTTPSGDTCRYQTKKQQFIGVSPLFPRTSNSFRNTLHRGARATVADIPRVRRECRFVQQAEQLRQFTLSPPGRLIVPHWPSTFRPILHIRLIRPIPF